MYMIAEISWNYQRGKILGNSILEILYVSSIQPLAPRVREEKKTREQEVEGEGD